MTQPSNIHWQLHEGPKLITDPGDGGTINVTRDLQICEVVTTSAETRTLANPRKAGILFTVRLMTDGGTMTLTSTNGLNRALETQATFADAGDFLSFMSVSLTATTFRWEILEGNVGTDLA